MKRTLLILVCAAVPLLAACGAVASGEATPQEEPPSSPPTDIPTQTPPVSPTPDPCVPGPALEEALEPLLDLQRTFDDGAELAANTPHSQIAEPIADLQALRREAEDLSVPGCLDDLKAAQIDYMNAVIETLLAFLRGTTTDEVNALLDESRARRLIFEDELARVRGVTLTPPPTLPAEEAGSE